MDSDGKRILIVEDERDIVESLKESLLYYGYNVLGIVTSGNDAIKFTKMEKPDMVLMDIELNGETDGVHAATHIYTHYRIPVIYVTGQTDSETIERAKRSVPYGYIVKPFDQKEIKIAIELGLYKHKMESERDEMISKIQNTIADMIRSNLKIEDIDQIGNKWFA